MEQIADGGYIITGSTWSDDGVPNVLLIKTDANGLIDSKAVSEVPWGIDLLALAVLGLILVRVVVFSKRKR